MSSPLTGRSKNMPLPWKSEKEAKKDERDKQLTLGAGKF